jgi:glycosyltransferase involved in cell wall biosynthesis
MFLLECLRSIQSQTVTDWECIVVSDGSPWSEQIHHQITTLHDDRFRLEAFKENHGPSFARNEGVRHSLGEYVLCVDEDDRLRKHCLELLITTARESSADVVVPGFCYFGDIVGDKMPSLPQGTEFLVKQGLLGAGFLMARCGWDKVGGFDESLEMRDSREDFEFWIRVFAAGLTVKMCPKILYEYRRDSRNPSREVITRLNEVRMRQVIVRKHRILYDRNLGRKWAFLSGGYEIEAKARWEAGDKARAVLRSWSAFMTGPTITRLIDAVSLTCLFCLRTGKLPLPKRAKALLKKLGRK